MTTALTEYPGLEAKAQQLFEISYAELGPRLQKCVRSKVVQEAALELLEALKAVITHPSVIELLAPEDSLGSLKALARDAIAKAEGRQ